MAFTIKALGILDPGKANPKYQTEIIFDMGVFEDLPKKEKPYAVCNHLLQGEASQYYSIDADGNMKIDAKNLFLDKCIRLGNLELEIDGKKKPLEDPKEFVRVFGIEGNQFLGGAMLTHIANALMRGAGLSEGEVKN